MITCIMDKPQLGQSQNVFQVTEEVGEEDKSAQSTPTPTSETTPISQATDLSPSFIPPDESSLGEGLPSPEGGGFFRTMILILIVIIMIGGIYFVIRYVKNRGGNSGGQASLNYWGLWEDESVMQSLIEAYQKQNPNVKIKYTMQTPKQYRDRLSAAIDRGEVDIFRYHNTWVPMLKDKLAVLPENILAKKEFEKIFYPVVSSDLKVTEGYVGIPLMIDGLALYYNEDIFKSAGRSVPKTWDELQETAMNLTVKDTNGELKTAGIALGTAENIEHFSDILALMFMQNDANLKNLISAEATEALSYYRLFAEKPNNTWDEAQPNSIEAFASGRVAMIFAPSWEALLIMAKNKDLKFKTAPVPQLPGTNITWASYWVEGVAKNSKAAQESWKFLKFLSEKDNLVKLYALETQNGRSFGEPYPRTDLAQTLTDHPILGAYIIQAPQAKSFPLASRTSDDGLNDKLIDYLKNGVNSLSSGGSPEGALTTMASGFKQILTQYGVIAPASQ